MRNKRNFMRIKTAGHLPLGMDTWTVREQNSLFEHFHPVALLTD